MRLKYLTLLTIAACVLGATAAVAPARADQLDDILKRKKVLIAVQTDVPPYSELGPDNKPAGYDIDVATKIAADLGVEPELVIVSGANRIPTLLAGKADLVIATLGITPQRAQVVALSSPYVSFDQYVIAPKDKAVKSIEDLKGVRVGVTRGTLQDDQVTRRAPKGTQIMRFEDDATTIQALLSGQIDATAFGKIVTDDLIKKNPSANLENKFELFAVAASIGVRRNEPDLLRWVNTWVFFHKQDGWLDETHKKWLGEALPSLPVF
jgi:polar amino acid transport system substrate-binding protein